MREHFEVLRSAGQLKHSERSTDVAVDSVVDSGVEVDAGCAVDDYVASVRDFLLVRGGEAEAILQQVALSTSFRTYIGSTLLMTNSSNLLL